MHCLRHLWRASEEGRASWSTRVPGVKWLYLTYVEKLESLVSGQQDGLKRAGRRYFHLEVDLLLPSSRKEAVLGDYMKHTTAMSSESAPSP